MSLRQNASTYWSSSIRCPSSRSVVDGLLGEAAVGHLGVGALQRGVDRGDGGLERLGDLGGRPAQHVAQDEHRALAGRQVLEGGDEGEPDRVALGDHDGGVGHRLEPGDLVVLLERVAGHLVGRAEPGGQRPSGPALEVGEADVGGDPVEPGADRGAALEAGARPSRRAGTSPARGPRPRAPTRSSGSSAPAARADSARSGSGSRPARSSPVVLPGCHWSLLHRRHGYAPASRQSACRYRHRSRRKLIGAARRYGSVRSAPLVFERHGGSPNGEFPSGRRRHGRLAGGDHGLCGSVQTICCLLVSCGTPHGHSIATGEPQQSCLVHDRATNCGLRRTGCVGRNRLTCEDAGKLPRCVRIRLSAHRAAGP